MALIASVVFVGLIGLIGSVVSIAFVVSIALLVFVAGSYALARPGEALMVKKPCPRVT